MVDLDPLGPGLDRVLGLELRDGVRWDALLQTTGRLSARSLHDAVPRRDGLGMLTWPPGPSGTLQPFAVREALSAAQRGHDLVVVDLPRIVDAAGRRGGRPVRPAARGDHADGGRRRGDGPARRAATRGDPTRLVVRGHGVPVREVEQATQVPTAWTCADQRGLAEALDLGLGPVRSRRGPLGRAAEEVLATLAPPGPGAA